MNWRGSRRSFLSGAPSTLAALGAGQQTGWARASLEVPSRVEREFVVSVQDEKGEPLRGLGPRDFKVIEDGVTTEITEIIPEDRLAVTLAVLIHSARTSCLAQQLNLLRGLLNPLSSAAVKRPLPEDNLMLEFFGPDFHSVGYRDLPVASSERAMHLLGLYGDARFLPGLLCGSTTDMRRVEHGTVLLDAVLDACGRMSNRPKNQKALILMLDGLPEQCAGAAVEVHAALRRHGIPLYVLALSDEVKAGNALWAASSDLDGIWGRALEARSKAEAGAAEYRMLHDLRNGYRIRSVGKAGSQTIEVLVRGSGSVRVAGFCSGVTLARSGQGCA